MKRGCCYARRVTPLTEWYFDAGIGEDRAILVENGKIVEARIERHDGVKPGLVCSAQLITRVVGGTRGIVRLADGSEALLSPLPKGLNEGASTMVEIVRSAIDEKSRFKLPIARAAPEKEAMDAQSLQARLGASSAKAYHASDAKDLFEEHGWSEVLEQARSGVVPFDGGTLHIAPTPAMTLIDIDGNLPPVALAKAAAPAVAHAIRLMDIQGNIGIDFPALDDKGDRKQVADALDAAMVGAFERTAINGFGFMQLVTRRERQSLPEMLQYRAVTAHALELLRRVERDRGTGPVQLVVHPAIAVLLEKRPNWIDALASRMGRSISLRSDPALTLGGGFSEAVR